MLTYRGKKYDETMHTAECLALPKSPKALVIALAPEGSGPVRACQYCDRFMRLDSLRCPCCKRKLRTKPRHGPCAAWGNVEAKRL